MNGFGVPFFLDFDKKSKMMINEAVNFFTVLPEVASCERRTYHAVFSHIISLGAN